MKPIYRRICCILLFIWILGSLPACAPQASASSPEDAPATEANVAAKQEITIDDLDTCTIGIVTGTSWDLVVQKHFPAAERKYFKTSADVLFALKQGKIDAFLTDKTIYAGISWENPTLTHINTSIGNISNALILPKEGYNQTLLEQLNAFIAKSKSDGTLDALDAKWFGNAEPEDHPDYTALTGENGTIRVAISDSTKPTAYQKGSSYTGYEVDFLTRFAAEYGYRLDIEGMSFEALILSVASRKYDLGACGITITPERSESVTFTDPHFTTYGVAVVRSQAASPSAPSHALPTPEELERATFAILTGTIWDAILHKTYPHAEIQYYTSMADMLLALEQGKVDAILGDRTFYIAARWENASVAQLEYPVNSFSCACILAKDNYDPTLLSQLNEFIAQAKSDGTMSALTEKWFSDQEPTEHPDYEALQGENGTLRIAVDNASKPMTYRRYDTFTGFDVELLTLFAEAYGYRLEITGMSFDALIPSVSSGKCDIGICGIAITSERSESVTFSDSYLEMDGVIIVAQSSPQEESISFFEKICENLEKTFLRENRWLMILEGIGVTILISVCAVLGGTLLGFALYLLSRSDTALLRRPTLFIARIYSRIIAGTPVVVILMILFYVVFGSFRDMSGIVVAIIGFALTFGAFVYDHLTLSVNSVDRGQLEAAYALGYTKSKTLFRIVFPQAMTIFLPSYCSQAVDLVKATAVVGYIAVNDLTKMGDIIRSNTYEAFFPLITTAAIYFLLTWLLSLLLGLLKHHFEPKRRSRHKILKGVKTV